VFKGCHCVRNYYYKCIIIFHQRTCYNLPPWKCSNSHCNFHAFKASEISTLRCEIEQYNNYDATVDLNRILTSLLQ
jgi:hypothetical protein